MSLNVKLKLPLPLLHHTLKANSPRYTKPATPAASLLIHGAVALLWGLLFMHAFTARGFSAWSIGIVYIGYDTALLAFTFWQTLPLARLPATPPVPATATTTTTATTNPAPPALTIIIAAFNEASVLAATITALTHQTTQFDHIIIADDGSTDPTSPLLTHHYGFTPPAWGTISPPSPANPALRWLRLPHGGKARALNAALLHVTTPLFLTVDADTALAPTALAAMRDAFNTQPGLVAATGVLAPTCGPGLAPGLFEWFQTYEYIRNFLGRYAWAQMDSLLLISGAFACFRTAPVLRVGGFDADCLVEDYELIHRLRRHGYQHGLGWHSMVLGAAHARTSAPATVPGFLRQRRRWFGGFLQTQLWYRDMVGNPAYHRLGLMMLPVKAADTFQPIYRLCAFGFLLWYLITGRFQLLLPAGLFMGAKIIIDLTFHSWSIHLYRRWVGGRTKANIALALLAAIAEPFSFQLLRHLGACWGWVYFLTGQRAWGASRRATPKTT